MTEFFGFSDGGCINNGKKNARASYCSVVIDGKKRQIIRGKVKSFKYYLNDEILDIENNKYIDLENLLLTDTRTKITPTNNRGELLGIIYCFAILLNRTINEDVSDIIVDVYSDSLISVKTFNIWLPNRMKKGTSHEMKNFDLLIIADYLFDEIKKKYKLVNLKHIKSHQVRPCESEGTRALFLWLGNQIADKHCTILCDDNFINTPNEDNNLLTLY